MAPRAGWGAGDTGLADTEGRQSGPLTCGTDSQRPVLSGTEWGQAAWKGASMCSDKPPPPCRHRGHRPPTRAPALTRPRPAPQEVPTLRQLWARGQQVLLSYEDEAARSRHRVLWPGAPYWWGDQVKPEKLICYLEHMKSCGRPGGCRRQVPWAGWAQREGDGRPVRASACTGVSHLRAHPPTGRVCKCEHVQIRAHTPVHTCADTCAHACPHTCMWPL